VIDQKRLEKVRERRGFGGFPRQLSETDNKNERLPQGVVEKTILHDGKEVQVKRFKPTKMGMR
jgi:hypothetical protein